MQVSLQGCVRAREDGSIVGMCPEHYSKLCLSKGWYRNISWCANKRCDEMGMTLGERMKLTRINIKESIGLPARIRCTSCCDRVVTSHHLRAERITKTPEPPAKKMRVLVPEKGSPPRHLGMAIIPEDDIEEFSDECSSSEELVEEISEPDISFDKDDEEDSSEDSDSGSFSSSPSDDELGSDDEDVMEGTSTVRKSPPSSGIGRWQRAVEEVDPLTGNL